MKKFILGLSAVAVLASFSGCGYYASMPQIEPKHGSIKTDIKYELVGDVESSFTKCHLFGFIGNPFAEGYSASFDRVDSFGFEKFSLISDVAGAAAYEAIESMPNADAIFAPRWTEKVTGVPLIFTCTSVELKAKAIRYFQPGKESVVWSKKEESTEAEEVEISTEDESAPVSEDIIQ